jgi:hypothetical protein
MSRSRVLVAAVTCLALAGAAVPARAQDSARAAAPGVDSAQMYVGDWDCSAGSGERAVEGVWRINYLNGRFTGIVARPGVPVAPISSFTLRNGREFTLIVDFNSETWTFAGRLDNVRRISGTLSRHGGIDRLRAEKRAG